MNQKKPIIIAVTGASGALYAIRLIGRLIESELNVHLIFSDHGRELFEYELEFAPDIEKCNAYLSKTMNITGTLKYLTIFKNNDLSAPPASGNSSYGTMIVIPCSMNTLSSVSCGRASNLIERAADVMLKEKKRLILVPRETPLSAIQLKNMLNVTEAGGMILPAMPAFYFKPSTLDDIADFIAAKIFNAAGIDASFVKKWTGKEG